MPVEFSHAQYVRSSKEVLDDSAFVEDYVTSEDVTDKLLWLANVDNGFNADVDHLDVAIKSSFSLRSVTGNLTSGVLAAGTAADNADGANVWNNPTNVYTQNGVYSDSHNDAAERATNFLKCTNFGMSIPGGATITDVKCTAQGYFSDSGNTTLSAKLVKAGTIGGNELGNVSLTVLTPTSDTGDEDCGTAADDGTTGANVVPWTNPTNAQGAPDASRAEAIRGPTDNSFSNFLECTNFGFAVPAGNIVTNVHVDILGNCPNDGIANSGLYINYMIAGTMTTTHTRIEAWDDGTDTGLVTHSFNMPDTDRIYDAADVNNSGFGIAIRTINQKFSTTSSIDSIQITITYAPYTSFTATEFGTGLWGNTFTPAEINASNFGVAIRCQNSSGDNFVYIDQVSLEVIYTLNAPGSFTQSIKINPQGLAWEEIMSFTDTYTIGATTSTFTHQEKAIILGSALTNAKAPFQIGLFLTAVGSIEHKDVSMDGSYVMIYGDSE